MIFAPERMLRMELLTLSEDAERVTGLMARDGSVHIVERGLPPREGAPAGAGGKARHEEIARLSSLTSELLRLIDLSPVGVDRSRREAFLERQVDEVLDEASQALDELREAIEQHFDQREQAENTLRRLDEISEQMNLLSANGLSFQSLKQFEHFCVACGTIDPIHAGRLEDRLEDEPCTLAMRPVHGKGVAFLLIGDREQRERFDAILNDAGARMLSLPERFTGAPDEALDQVEIELWQQRDRLAELAREYESSREEWHAALSEWSARLRIHGVVDEAISHLGSDGTITMITGFVPMSRRAALVRRLEREAPGRYYAAFVPATEKETPTHLRNWRVFRPFEMFVKTYGLPGYDDIDPTPFVAISFLAMFGMMFGDVGHGLVLVAIGAGIVFLPYRLFLGIRDLGRILMMAGLSGTLFGFLFGSVFGVEEDNVLPALWMRPSHPENLTTFLTVALVLGIVILSTGIVLNIVQALRHRDIRKALLGQWSAASLTFYWALLVLFGLWMMGKEVPIPPSVIGVALAVPLFLIPGGQVVALLRQRRERERDARDSGQETRAVDDAAEGEEGEEEELASILFEPIEIVMNLFTNSVSFLRVAAFGLAHAALTMAVFIVNDMVHVPGASVLSLPFEHLFIIVLEGMIVTIQCLRLEYYEFFSKFFVGDGVAYAPLTIRANEDVE